MPEASHPASDEAPAETAFLGAGAPAPVTAGPVNGHVSGIATSPMSFMDRDVSDKELAALTILVSAILWMLVLLLC